MDRFIDHDDVIIFLRREFSQDSTILPVIITGKLDWLVLLSPAATAVDKQVIAVRTYLVVGSGPHLRRARIRRVGDTNYRTVWV